MTFLEKNLNKMLASLVFAAVLAAMAAVVTYALTFRGGIASEQLLWSQFGDYFGGVLSPVFAFFALIGLLLALRVQSYELELTRKELAKSSEALARQSKSLELQAVESRVFKMISLHHDIVNSM